MSQQKAEHRRLLAISLPGTQSDSKLSDSKLSDSTLSDSTLSGSKLSDSKLSNEPTSLASAGEAMVKVSPNSSYASDSTPSTYAANGSSGSGSPRASDLGESRADSSESQPPVFQFAAGTDTGASSRERGDTAEPSGGVAGSQQREISLRMKTSGAPAASEEEAARRMRTLSALAQQLFEQLAKWRKCNRRLSRDRRVERPIARPRGRCCSTGLKRKGGGGRSHTPSTPGTHPRRIVQTARSLKRQRAEAGAATEAMRGPMARRAKAEGALAERAATRGGDVGKSLGGASPGGGGVAAAEAATAVAAVRAVAAAAAEAALEAAAVVAAKAAVHAASVATAKAAAAAAAQASTTDTEASVDTDATEQLIATLSSSISSTASTASAVELTASREPPRLEAVLAEGEDPLLASFWVPEAWLHQGGGLMPPTPRLDPLPFNTALPVFDFPADAPAVLGQHPPHAADPMRSAATAAALAARATAASLSAFADPLLTPAPIQLDIFQAGRAPSSTPLPLSASLSSSTKLPRVRGHQRRTKIWPSQLEGLSAAFANAPTPDGPERARLAVELGMKERSVQIWFQNQRSKVKARDKAAAIQCDELSAPQSPLAQPPSSAQPPSKRPRSGAKELAPPPPPRPPPSPPLSPPGGKCPSSATAPASPTIVWAPEAAMDAPPSTGTMAGASVTSMGAHWLKMLGALLLLALPLTAFGLARGFGYLKIVFTPVLCFVVFSTAIPVAGPHARALPYLNGLHFAMAAVRLHATCVQLLGTVPWEPLLLLWLGDAAAQQGSSPSIWTLRPEPRPGAHAALVASTAAVVARALVIAASSGRLFWACHRATCVFQGMAIGLRALYEIHVEMEAARASTSYPPPSPLPPPQHGGDDIVKISTGGSLVAACLLVLTALLFSPANRRHLAALRLQPPRSRPLRLRKLRLLPRGHSVLIA